MTPETEYERQLVKAHSGSRNYDPSSRSAPGAHAGSQSEWRRIRVPALDDQEGSPPPDGYPVLLFDGGFSLGWFEAQSMCWGPDEEWGGAPISDYDGYWWHPLPVPPKMETDDDD